MGDTTEASMWGREIVIAFDTKTATRQIRPKPVYKGGGALCAGNAVALLVFGPVMP